MSLARSDRANSCTGLVAVRWTTSTALVDPVAGAGDCNDGRRPLFRVSITYSCSPRTALRKCVRAEGLVAWTLLADTMPGVTPQMSAILRSVQSPHSSSFKSRMTARSLSAFVRRRP